MPIDSAVIEEYIWLKMEIILGLFIAAVTGLAAYFVSGWLINEVQSALYPEVEELPFIIYFLGIFIQILLTALAAVGVFILIT